jgi:4'-phosphopantetheinyl transferase EntD
LVNLDDHRTIRTVVTAGLLEQLLPSPIAVAEAFVDPPEARLFPAEEPLVARAVAKRRNEFTTARHCARTALARLGVPPVAILPGLRGAPGWPAGFVGSITHCEGYRAAAVARAADVVTIGLDAEPHEQLPPEVLDSVTVPAERVWLAEFAERRPDVHWDRLLFSAKETVYKGWFPLTQRWLGFEDACVTVDPDAGTFAVVVLAEDPTVLAGLQGRWLVRNGLIITAAVIWASSSGSIE